LAEEICRHRRQRTVTAVAAATDPLLLLLLLLRSATDDVSRANAEDEPVAATTAQDAALLSAPVSLSKLTP